MAALAALTLPACESAAPEVGVEVRDSAGVRFVEHPPGVDPGRMVADSAGRTFGLAPGDTITLYRVAAGAFLPSGEIAIADAGNYRVVRWSTDGPFLGTVGGEGDGPGEFRNITWLQAGDGATLYDVRARRLTQFDADWNLEGSWTFSPERPEMPSADAIATFGAALGLGDGREVVAYDAAFADPVGEPGPMPLYAQVGVWDTTSSKVEDLGRFDLMQWWERGRDERPPVGTYLGGGRIQWAARDSVVAISDATRHRVDVLVRGRRSVTILEERARLPFAPDSVPPEVDGVADSLPAYSDVAVDSRGRVWVQRSTPSEAANAEWRAFGLDGHGVGDLALPADATILDATGDRLLLLRRTEFDEEYVELRTLGPGAGPA